MDNLVNIADAVATRRKSKDKMSRLTTILSADAPAADGLAFRELREALGVSLREIEEVAGVSRSFISDWETGGNGNPALELSLHQALRILARQRVQEDLVALAVLERISA